MLFSAVSCASSINIVNK
uniref:Uncharacterized protein n=1 Tax=Anguilla anguilla TaxID=7936 RepID=A0A0E9V0T0_ANGAN